MNESMKRRMSVERRTGVAGAVQGQEDVKNGQVAGSRVLCVVYVWGKQTLGH